METVDFFRVALKNVLKQKGIKQIEIAKRLGLDPPALSAFLRGKINFSIKRQELLAETVGSSYIEMLNYGKSLAAEPTGHTNAAHEALMPDVIRDKDVKSEDVTLNAAEQRLINIYRRLNGDLKQLLMNMATDLFIGSHPEASRKKKH
ncbi:MAG: helix-turn-helix transcriptional regulator [Desulfobacteraceae bacterium]|nr:helix-turn-helix transcriptional regulator [Desulfobacteraceae bacterium]